MNIIKVSFFLVLTMMFFSCSQQDAPPEFYSHKDYELIFENDPNGITLYFTGSNYSDYDFRKENGQYRNDGIRILNELFATPPFSEYKEYFNAYIVYINPEPDADPFDNAPEIVVRELFPNFKETDVVMISEDNPQFNQGVASGVVAAFPYNNRSIMVHEVGHVVGNLADEYSIPGGDYADYVCDEAPNVDITNNPNEVKWSHFIGLDGYENIDVFVGGCYTAMGAYRAANNCVMRRGFFFCAPCREGIVKKIMQVKGLPFNFQEFLAKDIPL